MAKPTSVTASVASECSRIGPRAFMNACHTTLGRGSRNSGTSNAKHVLVGGASTVIDTSLAVPGSPVPQFPVAITTFQGLPVVGFAAISFQNGNLNVGGSLLQSNYGANFDHKATRNIGGFNLTAGN